jgi:RNA polymerase sigma-70 factor, ECF subfamily
VPRTDPDEGNAQRDRELLGALDPRRPEVLAELYDRHAASLFRHAMALTRRRADAEDLVHATFLKLATTGADLRTVKSPAAYLHRMLHTAWVDGRRRSAVGDRVTDAVSIDRDDSRTAPEDSIDLARALDQLPVAQRQAIALHLVEGLSFRDIGRATRVSLFTAAARYRLGIARLRTHLTRQSGGRP